jgi:outer membrane autotransporter protein
MKHATQIQPASRSSKLKRNRLKAVTEASGLAVAMLLFACPQVVRAQSTGAAVVFLPAPAGAPAGSGSQTSGISADGSSVAGNDDESVLTNNIVVWTNAIPRTIVVNQPTAPRPIPQGFNVRSISGDGRTILGNEGDNEHRAVIWTQAMGAFYFPDPSATEYIAFDTYANSDGTFFAATGRVFPTIAGGASNPLAATTPERAYRYSAAGSYQNLGSFGATVNMRATGISGAGDIIVGNASDITQTASPISPLYIQSAFSWNATTGLSRLVDLLAAPGGGSGPFSEANGISRDGSTIVGASRGSNGFAQAVYWRGNSVIGLGFLPGSSLPTSGNFQAVGTTHALASDADGTIIVGTAYGQVDDLAWRWTAASGMQDLNVIARNAGLNLNGFVLNNAVGISDNGQSITGNAYSSAQNQFLGFVLQLAQVTQSRLIVTIRLPGVTLSSIVNQSFSTQVDGLLNGRSVFTRTVTDPITGAGGVTALADARATLRVGSGLRRVVIGAPTLISNTTTVTGTTNAVVDVASGTSTSTATVNAFGPTVVATGNLGTCATPAANNTNPTGCSLPGTPTTVDAGILNSNVFTNTLNTVTPQTTPTVNQLITAKWQVSASAGNQFGTVHALVGPVAFDRGDRFIGQLIGMGKGSQATGASTVNKQTSNNDGLTTFGGYFGNSSKINADAQRAVADIKGSSSGFVLGAEKAFSANAYNVRAGLALDHGSSDHTVRDPQYAESLSLKHTQLALYGGWNSGAITFSGAAAYGFGKAQTTLNTPTTPATGSRDVRSWSIGAQAAYLLPFPSVTSATVEVVGGLRHACATLSRFAEVGGPTPLIGLDQTVHRSRLYVGLEATSKLDLGNLSVTPRVHARLANDSGNSAGSSDLVFASASNGPTMQALGPNVGKTVTEIGASVEAVVAKNVRVWVGYDGSLRSGSQTHAAKAGLTVSW